MSLYPPRPEPKGGDTVSCLKAPRSLAGRSHGNIYKSPMVGRSRGVMGGGWGREKRAEKRVEMMVIDKRKDIRVIYISVVVYLTCMLQLYE